MKPTCETVLSTLSGDSENDRILLVLCQRVSGTQLELRQQSWADGVGWFTQSSVTLEPQQVAQLRAALGFAGGGSRATNMTLPRSFAQLPKSGFTPRVVTADSA